MGRPGTGSRWPPCCGPETPGQIPPPTHRGGPARGRAASRSPAARGAGPGRFLRPHARVPHLADRQVPADAWTPTYDGGGQVRAGAWVADIIGLLDLDGWPTGMRVISRKERPHPGTQLRFTDIDGHRFTAFATGTRKGQLAGLELHHRRRARCEDRIRNIKDTGLRNLPLKRFRRTRSGAGSSRWPANCWPGPRCSPRPGRRVGGSRNGCGCACSPSRAARPPAAGACGSGSPGAGPGPPRSPPRSPGCTPFRPADQPEQPLRPGRKTPGPVEPRPPDATAGQPGTAGTRKSAPGRRLRPLHHGHEKERKTRTLPR